MSKVREVAGGGRAVEVEPERLRRWFVNFGERNEGVLRTVVTGREVVVHAGNGRRASVLVPFGGALAAGEWQSLAIEPLVEHVGVRRRIGLLLVRLGAHSIGVAEGNKVVVSRTDRHLVHGRTSAGGWSQQRFARRRDKQAREALDRVARDAAEVLGPELPRVDAVVLGGDRRALDTLRGDGRLAGIFAIAEPRVLDVSEPRRSVLDDAARRARAVEIVLSGDS